MVEPNERVGAEWERDCGAHPRGKGLAAVSREPEGGVRDRAKRFLGQVGRRGIDGREVRGLGRVADVVRPDLEPEAVLLPAETQACSGDEPGLEPRLVEPGRADLPGRVGDVRGEDVQPAAATARGAPDDDVEHRLVLAEELGDRALLGG